MDSLVFLTDYSEKVANGTINIFSHLACFAGGNMAMAGRLLKRDEWTTLGLQLAESCARVQLGTSLKIAPSAWGWYDGDKQAKGWTYVSTPRRLHYNKEGFFVTNTDWVNRPEILESVFYAYRITGQQFWRDYAWTFFQQWKQYCDTGSGWAGIVNVNDDSWVFSLLSAFS